MTYLMVAPNGARLGKVDHPAIPLTLPETVETTRACQRAGADALHLHIRDADGRHSLDAGRYREALAELSHAVPEMRVQITTEAAGIFSVEDQLACLRGVRPEWTSVSVREIARAPELADHLYGTCADQGTEVQHILYDAEDIDLLMQWQTAGIVRPRQRSVILVLGRYDTGQPSHPSAVAPFAATLLRGTPWMLCAFGPAEHACLREAARLGGACRVGLENSLTNSQGHPWRDNASSVAALRHIFEKNAA